MLQTHLNQGCKTTEPHTRLNLQLRLDHFPLTSGPGHLELHLRERRAASSVDSVLQLALTSAKVFRCLSGKEVALGGANDDGPVLDCCHICTRTWPRARQRHPHAAFASGLRRNGGTHNVCFIRNSKSKGVMGTRERDIESAS